MKSLNLLKNAKFLVILVILVILFTVFFLRKSIRIQWAQRSPEATASLFWNSMQHKDDAILNRIVASKKLDDVEVYLSNSQDPPQCVEDEIVGPIFVGNINSLEDTVSISFNCWTVKNTPYCFKISGIHVTDSEGKWIIDNWERIQNSC